MKPPVLLPLALSMLWCLESLGATLQAELVKDINPGARSSSPSSFVKVGQMAFFAAEDAINGRELWKTDGTQAGTVRLKDIHPGAEGSLPNSLVAAGDCLFFVADDGISGREVWTSDGTEDGTRLVKDIWSGRYGSDPASLVTCGRLLFFTAMDGAFRAGLWRTDGTEVGTVFLLQDESHLSYGDFTPSPSRGLLFFSGPDYELWYSDGTPGGTALVKDINPDGDSNPGQIFTTDGALYFWAYDVMHGYELWKSDGTEAGTVLVKDIFPGPGGSSPAAQGDPAVWKFPLVEVKGTIFFPASDGSTGFELWKSDGTESGTAMVKDINPGPGSSLSFAKSGIVQFVTTMINMNGTLFFTAYAYPDSDRIELWKSDGTELGTVRIKELPPHFPSPDFEMADVNGALFFADAEDVYSEAHGWTVDYQLWKSGGTPEGTVPVEIHPRLTQHFFSESVAIGGTVILATSDDNRGTELWKVRLGPWFEDLAIKDGQLSGEILGPAGARFQVQSSADLNNWADLTIVTNATGQSSFKVPATIQPSQFFRSIEILP